MSKYDMEWCYKILILDLYATLFFYLIKNTISYNLRLLKNKDILGMSLYKMIRQDVIRGSDFMNNHSEEHHDGQSDEKDMHL